MGIVVHHTASSTSSVSDTNWMWQNSPNKPVGAIYLGRNGEVIIGAAGATNCAGAGGPRTTSKGTIAKDTANSNTISIEAANAGTGEPWPTIQQDTYVALVAALCEGYGLDPIRDVMAHFEWAPSRKIDPAGNSRYAVGGNKWNMDRFRADVAKGAPAPLPPKPIPPQPPSGGDWMANLPTIKKGSTGPYVERMQHLLAAAGYMDPGNVSNYDGVWGNGTDNAKAKFDNAHGLTPSPPTDCSDKSWESLMTGKKW